MINPSNLLKPQRYREAFFRRWHTFSIKRLEAKKPLGLDVNFSSKPSSKTKIDVVIPAIDKDFETLQYVIDSIRKFVMHPIGKIYIISPSNSEKIKEMCQLKRCEFVDENTVLPTTKKDISYRPKDDSSPDGIDRSGWVFQQLLKWGADQICEQEYFLITESDTIFIRPRIFEYKGKVIIPCSTDPCHIPYFKSYEKLLGEKIEPIFNFTSHHSLFQKKVLKQLKKAIQNHCGAIWYKAIIDNLDDKEISSVSDYETYGQFLYSHFRNKVILEHWFNLSLKRGDLKKIEKLEKIHGNDFKAISFHSYNE